MRRAAIVFTLAGMFLPAACVDGHDTEIPEVLDVVGTPALEGELPRGIYVVIPPEHEVAEDPTQSELDVMYAGEVIIYMNKDGGTFTPGFKTTVMVASAKTSCLRPPMRHVMVEPTATLFQERSGIRP